jgi:hypothetical protein
MTVAAPPLAPAAPRTPPSESTAVPEVRLPAFARLVLLRPRRIRFNLDRVREAGVVPRVPNSWQIFLGIARMANRLVRHPEAVGTSWTAPMRTNWRAKLLRWRPLRFPFLLWEGSVVPLDLSGLGSSPERLTRHLLGTYHPGDAAVYDLELLQVHPRALEEARRRCLEVVRNDTRRSRWLRDLCVYTGYHEELLAALDRALAGDFRFRPDPHSDTTLAGYLAWCASRPATPAESWRAWRRGELGLGDAAPGEGTPTGEVCP